MRRSIRLFIYANDCNSRCTSLVFWEQCLDPTVNQTIICIHKSARNQQSRKNFTRRDNFVKQQMCIVRGISNALRAKVRKFSRPHRITRARSRVTTFKNRIQFQYLACSNAYTCLYFFLFAYLYYYTRILDPFFN